MKKLLNLISGIMTPVTALLLLRFYLQSRQWKMGIVIAFAFSAIIYLATGADEKYRYAHLWKRILRLFMFPAGIAFAVFCIISFTEKDMVKGVQLMVCTVVLSAVYYALFKPGLTMSESALLQMEGHEFEEYCAKILRRNGFRKVEVTQASNDYGADIIARRRGQKWVVQCKRYQTPIGNTPVQEVVAAMSHYDAKRAAVMTNSTFTKNALELAKSNDVLLIDGDRLQKMSRA